MSKHCKNCGRLNTETYGEKDPNECVWCRNGYESPNLE